MELSQVEKDRLVALEGKGPSATEAEKVELEALKKKKAA